MKNEFTKFNLLLEEVKNDLLLEKKKGGFFSKFKQDWTLQEELEGILPYIAKKLSYAFGNFYESGQPGEIDLADSEPQIFPIEEGSSTPGFQIIWDLYEGYVKDNLLPCLLKNPHSRFIELNKKYHLVERANKLDPQLILRINARDNNADMDLSKPDVLVKKFSVDRWDGTLYLNFNCEGVDKEKSNIKIGDVDVFVKLNKYDAWGVRFLRQLTKGGQARANEPGLMDELGEMLGFTKKNKSGLDTVKVNGPLGKTIKAQIKVSVSFDRNIKKSIDIDDVDDKPKQKSTKEKLHNKESNEISADEDNEFIDEKLIKKLGLDFDRIKYDFSEHDIRKTVGEQLSDKNTWKVNGNDAAGDILLMYNSPRYIKNYRILLDLNNWRHHNHDVTYLLDKNPVEPKITINFADGEWKRFYENSYTLKELKEVEPKAYQYIKTRLENLKDE